MGGADDKFVIPHCEKRDTTDVFILKWGGADDKFVIPIVEMGYG